MDGGVMINVFDDIMGYAKSEIIYRFENGRIIAKGKTTFYNRLGKIKSIKEEDISSCGFPDGKPMSEAFADKLISDSGCSH